MDEAFYYVTKSRAVAILASSSAVGLGRILEKKHRSDFRCVSIVDSIFNPPMQPSDFVISDKRLDSNGAALVIFTSGTYFLASILPDQINHDR